MDMLGRNWAQRGASHDEVSGRMQPFESTDLYVAGFPCTPYSSLHHQSAVFDDPAAAPMYCTFDTLHKVRPKISILENVQGLLRASVWPEIERLLLRLVSDDFSVAVFTGVSPEYFGIPVSRPRVYIVVGDNRRLGPEFQNRLVAILERLARPCELNYVTLVEKYLPHTDVQLAASCHQCTCSVDAECQRLLNRLAAKSV